MPIRDKRIETMPREELKKLQKEIPVELTDEFVKETLEADYETVEQYKAGMKEAILAEQAIVRETIALRAQDSRLGFEASNQYYYSMQDLVEKQINLAYLLERC